MVEESLVVIFDLRPFSVVPTVRKSDWRRETFKGGLFLETFSEDSGYSKRRIKSPRAVARCLWRDGRSDEEGFGSVDWRVYAMGESERRSAATP